jgi:phage protein U
MSVIGSFGGVVFEVSRRRARSFEGLTHEEGARLSTTEIVGGPVLTEFLGPDGESVSFTIRLAAALGVDPGQELARLSGMCATGTAAALVVGGKPIGGSGARWLIARLSSEYTQFGRDGRPVWIDVGVSLQRYVSVS